MLHILHCIYSILQTGCLNTRNSYLIFLTTGTILTRTAEFSHRKLYSVTCSTFWADLQIKNKHWLLTKQNILDEASKYPYHDFFSFFKQKLTIAHPQKIVFPRIIKQWLQKQKYWVWVMLFWKKIIIFH